MNPIKSFEGVVKDFRTLSSLMAELRNHYGLVVNASSFDGKRLLHITRSKENTPLSSATDGATVAIVTKDMKIAAISSPKFHPYGSPYTTTDFGNAANPKKVKLEKKYKGIRILAAKHDGKVIVCTEKDAHACDMVPNTGIAAFSLFSHLVNYDFPRLFSFDTYCNTLSYEFMMVRRENMPPDSNSSYDLFLVGAIDKKGMIRVNEIRLDHLADKMGVMRPEREFVNTIEEATDQFRQWTITDQTVNGMILTDCNGNQSAMHTRAGRRVFKYCKSPTKENLLLITEMIMRGKEEEVLAKVPRFKHLVSVMRGQFNILLFELKELEKKYGKAKTRKHLAEKIHKHDLALVLFALNSGRISSLSDMHSVLRPQYLFKIIKRNEGHRLVRMMTISKEVLCQSRM